MGKMQKQNVHANFGKSFRAFQQYGLTTMIVAASSEPPEWSVQTSQGRVLIHKEQGSSVASQPAATRRGRSQRRSQSRAAAPAAADGHVKPALKPARQPTRSPARAKKEEVPKQMEAVEPTPAETVAPPNSWKTSVEARIAGLEKSQQKLENGQQQLEQKMDNSTAAILAELTKMNNAFLTRTSG